MRHVLALVPGLDDEPLVGCAGCSHRVVDDRAASPFVRDDVLRAEHPHLVRLRRPGEHAPGPGTWPGRCTGSGSRSRRGRSPCPASRARRSTRARPRTSARRPGALPPGSRTPPATTARSGLAVDADVPADHAGPPRLLGRVVGLGLRRLTSPAFSRMYSITAGQSGKSPSDPKWMSSPSNSSAPASRAVVDEEVAAVEVLVVRQDEPLVRDVVEVPAHPEQLVRPGAGVRPRRRREDVGVEEAGELLVGLDRVRHRVHEGEDPGDVVFVADVAHARRRRARAAGPT